MVEIDGLEKAFGALKVLNGVDLSIKGGEITAIVGPNAAGKTTLIKCIVGLVLPDAGDIRIQGVSIRGRWEYRQHIGYMPQVPRFPEHLSLYELIRLVRGIRGVHAKADAGLLQGFGLDAVLHRPLRVLSGGMRQRVNAVLALLFDPDILILDEPTAGLDPIASSRQKDRILAERSRGKAIVVTSHVMSEVEELADRVVFLLEGQIGFDGTPETLRTQTGEPKLERAIAQLMQRHRP
jgi:Cu-processing system ATP-binding protein